MFYLRFCTKNHYNVEFSRKFFRYQSGFYHQNQTFHKIQIKLGVNNFHPSNNKKNDLKY
jgi:hypothetical protein